MPKFLEFIYFFQGLFTSLVTLLNKIIMDNNSDYEFDSDMDDILLAWQKSEAEEEFDSDLDECLLRNADQIVRAPSQPIEFEEDGLDSHLMELDNFARECDRYAADTTINESDNIATRRRKEQLIKR